MSALLREELLEAMQRPLAERLVVSPMLDPGQVGPSSIDLRLGTEFIAVQRHAERAIDPFDANSMGGARSPSTSRSATLSCCIPGTSYWVRLWSISVSRTICRGRCSAGLRGDALA